jgi:hypothetical protein
MSTSHVTTNHSEIKRWAEERGGFPAAVKRTESKNDLGVLRIDFPGYSGEDSLERVDWDSWFEKFDASKLALVYQGKTADGKISRFNKLVSRDKAEDTE